MAIWQWSVDQGGAHNVNHAYSGPLESLTPPEGLVKFKTARCNGDYPLIGTWDAKTGKLALHIAWLDGNIEIGPLQELAALTTPSHSEYVCSRSLFCT